MDHSIGRFDTANTHALVLAKQVGAGQREIRHDQKRETAGAVVLIKDRLGEGGGAANHMAEYEIL